MSESNTARDEDDEAMRAAVSRLWAEDWDSDEDALYDRAKEAVDRLAAQRIAFVLVVALTIGIFLWQLLQ